MTASAIEQTVHEQSAAVGAPAVVATMSYSGLALARSLARRGVKVYGVATSADEVGMSSRFITPAVYPDMLETEERTVAALLDLAQKIGERALLFPTGDAILLPVSRHREELEKHYSFLIPDRGLAERLVSKSGLSDSLAERGIPGPRTLIVMEPSDLDALERDIQYPAIIKPVYSASWYTPEMVDQIGHRKVVMVENREELRHWYALIASVDPRVVLQEYVPGEDARLFYVCGYFGADGKLEAAFAGQKLRIVPVHFGSASFVSSVQDDRLIDATRQLLQPLGYKGLFGVEFKLDPRDDIYKVIEVNVRWGLWDGLARRCGVDLAFLAYARQTGVPFEVDPCYRTGVKWVSLRRDLDAFLSYRKERSLSTLQWIRSLPGPTSFATFAWDDPVPFLRELGAIARSKVGGVWSRLRKSSRA